MPFLCERDGRRDRLAGLAEDLAFELRVLLKHLRNLLKDAQILAPYVPNCMINIPTLLNRELNELRPFKPLCKLHVTGEVHAHVVAAAVWVHLELQLRVVGVHLEKAF